VTADRRADTILTTANVITVDTGVPRDPAVAVRDGRIAAVGSAADALALRGPGTQVLDLADATVLPGFIDAHIHPIAAGVLHATAADCDLPSIAAVLNALRTHAAARPAAHWVQGFKFDDTKTAERRFLTRTDLDSVSADRPVFVSHRAGHVYFANSRALELVGYTEDSPDPPGGRLGRDPATGRLNSVLYERARDPIKRYLPAESDETRRAGLRLMQRRLAAAGITSAHDVMATAGYLDAYRNARDSGDLTLRVYCIMHRDHMAALPDARGRAGHGDDWVRTGAVKLVSDGAIAARTAYVSESYAGTDDHGILAMSPEETLEWVTKIHRAGPQVCTHANGDRAIKIVLDAYEKAQAAFPRPDPRFRIEHCTIVDSEILRRMKSLGAIATPFCTYVHHHGEKMRFFGAERLERMFAHRSFLDYGTVSTGASDYPPGPYEPLIGIQSCVTRTDSEGNLWGPSQRITVEEAIRIYTLHGAFASVEERLKGSITPGKLADLVVLATDPTLADPSTIKDIPVLRTIVGGKTVYEA